jgi:TPR repeat protein
MYIRVFVLLALFVIAPDVWASGVHEPSAELKEGITAYNESDFYRSATLLKTAADRGEAEAMVNLGYLYARGQGVPQDSALALQLYRRASDLGDAEAMNAVGYRLMVDKPPDYPGAAHWFCMAVLQGNQRAMNNLALLFYDGHGLPLNQNEARSLWAQAVERGSLNAQVNLGYDLVLNNPTTSAERHQGMEMLLAAARQGSEQAQARLQHLGVTENYFQKFNGELPMHLEPAFPKPGHSSACKDYLVS